MKSILLIGLGKFGRHTAMKLNELGHQVMAVDENAERVERILSYVDNGQIGNSTDPEFLRSLGVRNFDLCIVGIGKNFQASLETTSLLKELGAGMVVSLAASDVHAKFLTKLGADEVVYPERQLANWAAIRYSSDHIFDYIVKEYMTLMYQLFLHPRLNLHILNHNNKILLFHLNNFL